MRIPKAFTPKVGRGIPNTPENKGSLSLRGTETVPPGKLESESALSLEFDGMEGTSEVEGVSEGRRSASIVSSGEYSEEPPGAVEGDGGGNLDSIDTSSTNSFFWSSSQYG